MGHSEEHVNAQYAADINTVKVSHFWKVLSDLHLTNSGSDLLYLYTFSHFTLSSGAQLGDW